MSAKILAFDSNRRVPPRHYTPIALRGRILYMSPRPGSPGGAEVKVTASIPCFQGFRTNVHPVSNPAGDTGMARVSQDTVALAPPSFEAKSKTSPSEEGTLLFGKLLAFDPNRKAAPRHCTPVATRGRVLQMSSRSAKRPPESLPDENRQIL